MRADGVREQESETPFLALTVLYDISENDKNLGIFPRLFAICHRQVCVELHKRVFYFDYTEAVWLFRFDFVYDALFRFGGAKLATCGEH